MKICIAGYGVTGKAVHNLLTNHDVSIYDPPLGCEEFDFTSDACFLCLPTPTVDGRQDDSIVLEVLDMLLEKEYAGLVILRSTMVPSFWDRLGELEELNLICVPEFLNAHESYIPDDCFILGVKDIYQVHEFRQIFSEAISKITDRKTASMIKMAHNLHGCVKVTFFNELYDYCQTLHINYRTMLDGLFFVNDNVGQQYTRIGADGQRGFGGMCYPHNAISMADEMESEILRATVSKNIKYRPEEMLDKLPQIK